MNVDEINALDLSYTPPLGSPWDAVQVAAQAWTAGQKNYQSVKHDRSAFVEEAFRSSSIPSSR